MSLIPSGWKSVRIGDICTLKNGRAFKPTEWTKTGLPIVRIQNLNNPSASFNYFNGEFEDRYHLKGGELVFAWSGTPGTSFGAHIWRGGEAVLNQHIFRVDFDESVIDKRFLRRAINQKLGELIDIAHGGVGLRHVTKGKFEATEILLAPLAEQKRIADKLDRLLAAVDTCKARLDAIPAILKRFRQSVLAAATSGELTEEWRAARGLQLAWRNVRLDEIADIQGGITKDSKKQSATDREVPYLRVANVQRGYLDLSEIKTIRVPEGKLSSLMLEPGDALFTEGGDIDKLGRGWIWEGQIANCTYQNHIFRARLLDKRNQPKYVSWWANHRGLSYFLGRGKQTTNLASINKSQLSALPISLPSPEEQAEIVAEVAGLLSAADQLEAKIESLRALIERLRRSLLAAAFRGGLVPRELAALNRASGSTTPHRAATRIARAAARS